MSHINFFPMISHSENDKVQFGPHVK